MKVTTDGCLFGALIPPVEQGRILDIGTGTGLLSLMLAQKTNQKIHIDAVEVNEASFLEASKNISSSDWASRINTFHTSIQYFKPEYQYDLVVSNPPFFGNHQKGMDDRKNTALHNDLLSMPELITTCLRLLSPEGQLWIMYPAREMTEFEILAKDAGLCHTHSFTIRNRCPGPVFRSIKCFSLTPQSKSHKEEIIIRNEQGTYTEAFGRLLSPYYLHL